MIAPIKPPSIIDDIIRQGKNFGGDGAFLQGAKKAAKVGAATADDAAMVMSSGGGLPSAPGPDDAANVAGKLNKQPRITGNPADDIISGGAPIAPAQSAAAPVKAPGGVFEAGKKIVDPIEKVAHAAGAASIGIDVLLPALGFVAGIVGLKGAKAKIRKPHEYMQQNKIGNLSYSTALMDGGFGVIAGVEGFRIAHSFSEKIDRLKVAMSDMTGTPVSKITTMQVLSGSNIPEVLKASRSHIIKEHLSRGVINAFSLGFIVRGLRKGTGISMPAFMATQAASMGVDALMGEDSLVQAYPTVKAAFESGKPVPTEMVAEFLVAASPELKHRGRIGQHVALEVAKQYVGVPPGEILKEMNGGQHSKFMNRVNVVLVKNEPTATAKKPAAAALDTTIDTAVHPAAMSDRVNGRNERAIQGKYTKQIAQEDQSVKHSLA